MSEVKSNVAVVQNVGNAAMAQKIEMGPISNNNIINNNVNNMRASYRPQPPQPQQQMLQNVKNFNNFRNNNNNNNNNNNVRNVAVQDVHLHEQKRFEILPPDAKQIHKPIDIGRVVCVCVCECVCGCVCVSVSLLVP